MAKKPYADPELELVPFSAEDVLTTSAGCGKDCDYYSCGNNICELDGFERN